MTVDGNVLACMILDGSERAMAKVVASGAKPDDFNDHGCGVVFGRLMNVWAKEGVITLVDAPAACQGTNVDPISLGSADIAYSRLTSYLEDLREQGMAKKLKDALNRSLLRLADGENPQRIMAELAEKQTTIGTGNTNRVENIGEVSDRLYAQYERAMTVGFDGVHSPHMHLDSILGGYPPGMHILAARPKVGKSSFAGCEALLMAQQGIPVYIASLEMSSERVIDRMIANLMSRGTEALWQGRADPKLVDTVNALRDKIRDLPIRFAANCRLNLDELLLDMRASMIRHGTQFAIIDHIGKIGAAKSYRSQYDKITDYSNRISQEALNMGLPVRTVCHVGRSGEGKEGAEIGMSDLRESGHLEQDAESIIFLNKDADYIAAHVAANRNGRSDWTNFIVNLNTQTWIDEGQ